MIEERNYKAMWNTLRSELVSSKKAYSNGYMMSLAESVEGENMCDEFLKRMDRIEADYE